MFSFPNTIDPSRHSALNSQQLRLRHFRTISARNLIFPEGFNSVNIYKYHLFFTLHKDLQSSAFHRSEEIEATVNPSWSDVEATAFEDVISTTTKTFVICMWLREHSTGESQVLHTWSLHTDSLSWVGQQLSSEAASNSQANHLYVGMLDGFYCVKDLPERSFSLRFHVNRSSLRSCSSLSSLKRVQTVVRAIKDTKAESQALHDQVKEKLKYTASLDKQLSRRQILALRVVQLQDEFNVRAKELKTSKLNHESMRKRRVAAGNALREAHHTHQQEQKEARELKRTFISSRESYLASTSSLVRRRRELVAELREIYPVEKVSPEDDSHYTICSIRVPNSEDFSGTQDKPVGAALGFTSHLLQVMHRIYGLPLRYPLTMHGSMSSIEDVASSSLENHDRRFCLYNRTKDRTRFRYAVYLLNKDIAQLRIACALMTRDPRLTLPNLKNFLDLKVGVHVQHSVLPTPVRVVDSATSTCSSSSKSGETGSRPANDKEPTQPMVVAERTANTVLSDIHEAERAVENTQLIDEAPVDPATDLVESDETYKRSNIQPPLGHSSTDSPSPNVIFNDDDAPLRALSSSPASGVDVNSPEASDSGSLRSRDSSTSLLDSRESSATPQRATPHGVSPLATTSKNPMPRQNGLDNRQGGKKKLNRKASKLLQRNNLFTDSPTSEFEQSLSGLPSDMPVTLERQIAVEASDPLTPLPIDSNVESFYPDNRSVDDTLSNSILP